MVHAARSLGASRISSGAGVARSCTDASNGSKESGNLAAAREPRLMPPGRDGQVLPRARVFFWALGTPRPLAPRLPRARI